MLRIATRGASPLRNDRSLGDHYTCSMKLLEIDKPARCTQPRWPMRVLAVGDLESAEFAQSLTAVRSASKLRSLSVAELSDPEQLAALQFDLLLVCQSRPGSVSGDWLEPLRMAHPLAGMVVLLGTWCEGEMRTGQPLPFCERIFWYQFEAWWSRNHSRWCEGRPTSWQWGVASPELGERQLPEARGLVAIETRDFDSAETLLVVCEELGLAGCWSPAGRGRPVCSPPAAGIWVGGQLDADEEPKLADFRRWLPPSAPLVVLLDFPRLDRVTRARELGATAVLGKPWTLEQLAEVLRIGQKSEAPPSR